MTRSYFQSTLDVIYIQINSPILGVHWVWKCMHPYIHLYTSNICIIVFCSVYTVLSLKSPIHSCNQHTHDTEQFRSLHPNFLMLSFWSQTLHFWSHFMINPIYQSALHLMSCLQLCAQFSFLRSRIYVFPFSIYESILSEREKCQLLKFNCITKLHSIQQTSDSVTEYKKQILLEKSPILENIWYKICRVTF